ncbi:unnamed protein product [Spirodela intermedia]|uniref:Uncharacterized protein n=1 Tax=Spirodela intermedia TaxID=51605 RepID=A0A7I8LJ38_SPIIN|nr:unnamed protein product [Spirodela intermedia]
MQYELIIQDKGLRHKSNTDIRAYETHILCRFNRTILILVDSRSNPCGLKGQSFFIIWGQGEKSSCKSSLLWIQR